MVLPCPVRGTPPPTVRWYKENVIVSPSTRHGVTVLPDGSLQLERAEARDAGSYWCVAENAAGNLSLTIDLHVYSEL